MESQKLSQPRGAKGDMMNNVGWDPGIEKKTLGIN